MDSSGKVLVIQTASIGDAILATPVVESIKAAYPGCIVDILVRRGYEGLFRKHPLIRNVLTWNKRKNKYRSLLSLLRIIRRERYEVVIDIHRFFSSGLLTALSGARVRAGFSKNPWSWAFTSRIPHRIGVDGIHEADRNLSLLKGLIDNPSGGIRLYPAPEDDSAVKDLKAGPYICCAPASLWFTKQYPESRWIEFLRQVPASYRIYLLGSGSEVGLCDRIASGTAHRGVLNLAGKLSFLETAALMRDAQMNFVNDSAPLHIASAMNAPVTAIFCSTVTNFGFGPRSSDATVVQTRKELACRPCGLHGYRQCPEKHFLCALTIDTQDLLKRI